MFFFILEFMNDILFPTWIGSFLTCNSRHSGERREHPVPHRLPPASRGEFVPLSPPGSSSSASSPRSAITSPPPTPDAASSAHPSLTRLADPVSIPFLSAWAKGSSKLLPHTRCFSPVHGQPLEPLLSQSDSVLGRKCRAL